MVVRSVCIQRCPLFAALLLIVMTARLPGQPKDSAAAAPVTWSGYVDSYYSYNFALPKTRVNELRNFDVSENQLVLSTAQLTVQRAPSPIGFRIDADFGPGNDIVQSGASGSTSFLQQAYATVVAPVGQGLTIDAGKFVTHCCFETIPAKDNFNYSRSFLFAWSVPYYHVGARASYPVAASLGLNAYLYNGWNGNTPNSGKNFGIQANYSPVNTLALTFNYLGGPALADSVSKSFRNLYELIVTLAATDRLTFAANGVYGRQSIRSVSLWKGVAGYTHYAINDISAATLRAEIFDDPEGFMTGTSQTLEEITLTYDIRPLGSLILRGEFRKDWSDKNVFDGADGTMVRKNQSTLGIGAIVVF